MKMRSALCAMIVFVTSAVALGQQVSVNYNHNQSFSQFHTYAWASNNANQIQNSILAQVAQQDIDTAMQGKGFTKVQESQKPDLILTSNGGMRQQTSYTAWGMRGIGRRNGRYYSSAERRRDFDRRSVQREHPVSGVAWNRSGYVEQ